MDKKSLIETLEEVRDILQVADSLEMAPSMKTCRHLLRKIVELLNDQDTCSREE